MPVRSRNRSMLARNASGVVMPGGLEDFSYCRKRIFPTRKGRWQFPTLGE
jgi:hypothetical protein